MQPDSEDIFLDNVIDTHYPCPPEELESICLYDFAANYNWTKRNSKGNPNKLTKPCLLNHKFFDCNNPDQHEDYYYALVLLFVPFRDESSLLLPKETAEEAFNRLLKDDEKCLAHQNKLQNAGKVSTKIKEINEAREELGIEERVDHDKGPQLLDEATTAMKDLANMSVKADNSIPFEERIGMLNIDQRQVFNPSW